MLLEIYIQEYGVLSIETFVLDACETEISKCKFLLHLDKTKMAKHVITNSDALLSLHHFSVKRSS